MRGTSVHWVTSKQCYRLAFTRPGGATGYKLVPKHIAPDRSAANEARAAAWARSWLQERGFDPSAALKSLRDQGPLVKDKKEDWLALRKRDVAASTYGDNVSYFKNHIEPQFGDKPIASLEPPVIRKWMRALKDKYPSTSTVRNIYHTFATFYEDAMAEQWVRTSVNVFKHPSVMKELPKVGQKEDVAWIPIEVANKLLNDERVSFARRVRYAVAFASAMRDGEIAGLTWADVDLESDTPIFRIQRAVALRGPEGHASEASTKTKRRRALAMHPAAQAALKEWRVLALDSGRAAPHHYVFTPPWSRPDKGWRPRSADLIRDDIKLIARIEDVVGATSEDDVVFHLTRHSLATWLEGVAPQTQIHRILGQAGADVTARHYQGGNYKADAAALAQIPLVWESTKKVTHESLNSQPLASPKPLQGGTDAQQSAPEDTPGHVQSAQKPEFLNRRSYVQVVSGAPQNQCHYDQGHQKSHSDLHDSSGWVTSPSFAAAFDAADTFAQRLDESAGGRS